MEYILSSSGIKIGNSSTFVSTNQLIIIYHAIETVYGLKKAEVFCQMVNDIPSIDMKYFAENLILLSKMDWVWNADCIDVFLTYSQLIVFNENVDKSIKEVKEDFFSFLKTRKNCKISLKHGTLCVR